MINLHEKEEILLVMHRHWIVIAERLVLGLFILILPYPAAALIKSFDITVQYVSWPFFWFFTVIYSMLIVLFTFLAWLDYYLDVWIITNERIVDIEQSGLFKREISEFMINKVQDVTIEIPNMTATVLKYGNITIQTAGERSFSIKQVPGVYKAKEVILSEARKQRTA
ncbi:PH domain-containing protein [Candidatus Giovannonibacteria bacterium]|nr:PH domain-containing protein [Candidatus Giovannonibacteria bacterium]